MPTLELAQMNYEHKLRLKRIKSANIGGEQDKPFEQAFSNLAHAYLRDKAPGLMQYEVGFQLLDRSSDNTKAIGLFGFKVGDQWLYAPVFFLNGDLKGHELLYIKEQDTFVPMKENWLNYLMNRKPDVLGKRVPRTDYRRYRLNEPTLKVFTESPGKYASYNESWMKTAAPALAYFYTTHPKDDPKYNDCLDLSKFLKLAGRSVFNNFIETCKLYPKFAASVSKVYDLWKLLDDTVQHYESKGIVAPQVFGKCASIVDSPFSLDELLNGPKTEKSGLTIITYREISDHGPLSVSLSQETKERAMRDGYDVMDTRPDDKVTMAYHVEPKMSLSNPTTSGLYDVLLKPGKFEKCLVLIAPIGSGSQVPNKAIVMKENASSMDDLMTVQHNEVFVSKQYMDDEFTDWVKKQSEIGNGKFTTSYDKYRIVVGRPKTGTSLATITGTFPFTVDDVYSTEDDLSKHYEVHFRTYCDSNYGDCSPDYPNSSGNYAAGHRLFRKTRYPSESNSLGQVVITDRIGSRMNVSGDILYVPKDCRVIELSRGDRFEYDDNGVKKPSNPPMAPGGLPDLQLAINNQTKLVKISCFDGGYYVSGESKPYSKTDLLITLMGKHGLREKEAQDVVSDVSRTKHASYFFKYADQYPLQKFSPSAPSFPDFPLSEDSVMNSRRPQDVFQTYDLPVQSLIDAQPDKQMYNPTLSLDQRSMNTAMDAAQTGQKEVFDTSVIGGLLKSVKDDMVVDRFMGDLMKGMDRIGRILFLFYWRGDQFEERYGKNDMPGIEDALRGTFEAIGDLILQLREKNVGAYDKLLKPDLTSITGDDAD